LGIRPENVLICEDNQPPSPDTPDYAAPPHVCEVIAVENMGNEQLIYLSLAGQTVIVRRPPSESIAAGDTVGIRFIPDQIYYLDEATDLVII
jgi:ABC-type sugar transport system ATPase subunit